MASGKRASMREGPLAALFRRTEEAAQEAGETRREAPPAPEAPRAEPEARAPEVAPATPAARARREIDPLVQHGPQDPPAHPRETGSPHPSLGAPSEPEEPAREEPRVRTPQERLRHAFSSEIPEDILEK